MSRINELDDERQKLRVELRNASDKLGETRTKIVTVRDELQQLRKTRDGLNDTVRALKKSRDALRESSKEKLAVLREVLKKMSDRPHASLAEKELATLEWQVQTTPLEKDEEKRMMTKIRRLEISVTGYHKVLKLRDEINKQREEADQLHARIQELAAESQKHHEDIVQLSETFQALRAKREQQQKMLDGLRGKAASTNREFLDVRSELSDEEKRIRRQKEEALKVSLKGTAQQKLSKGEKLTLLELGALYEGEEEEE
jgi:chromosome segregation protein